MKNPDYIRISLKPIISIGIILLGLMASGFVIDNVRSYSKLKKVTSHGQVIMSTNSSKILNAFRNPKETTDTLNKINEPEKNIYKISFLTTKQNEWKLYTNYQIYNLNSTTEEAINKIKDSDEIIQMIKGEDLLPNLIGYNHKQFILSGFPVKADGQDYGYVFVTVNKTTDLD